MAKLKKVLAIFCWIWFVALIVVQVHLGYGYWPFDDFWIFLVIILLFFNGLMAVVMFNLGAILWRNE